MFLNVKGKVIEVENKSDSEGKTCVMGNKAHATHQRWKVVYTSQEKGISTKGVNKDFGFHIGRPFYIRTRMGSGRAIEVTGGRNLVLKWKKWNSDSQQFYFDNATKTIKSQQYKDRSLDIQNSGKSSNMQVWNTNGRWW